MAALPYVTAPGNIEKALQGIRKAATPSRVSQDFVKTILKIPGGSGDQMTSYLKKLGFANPDGTPSEIYTRFRNLATSGSAAAEALKVAYAPLYKRNEYMHELSDEKLRGLIIEETGHEADSSIAKFVFASIKAVKKFAEWGKGGTEVKHEKHPPPVMTVPPDSSQAGHPDGQPSKLGLNLSYTINLNLPATSDIAVFNAIFKSLKENLLRGGNE